MIIVIEGPSAAGKTSWISKQVSQAILPEASNLTPPDREVHPVDAGNYWADVSAMRWAAAKKLELKQGLVICDSDPFKLHYVWSLWYLGETGKQQWEAELAATRKFFSAGKIGLADRIYISIPSAPTLAQQARDDTTRPRINFELHARMSEPLELWYKAIEQLDSNRVFWEFPSEGLPDLDSLTQRSNSSGIDDFDRLISLLPRIS